MQKVRSWDVSELFGWLKTSGSQIFWFWRLCPFKGWSGASEHSRNCNSQPREVSFLFRGLSSWWDVEYLLSIPHASPGVSNGHQIPSTSPTATSPVNRESSLSQMNIQFFGADEEAQAGDQEDAKDKMTEPKPLMSEVVTGSTTRRIQEIRIETQEVNDTNTTVWPTALLDSSRLISTSLMQMSNHFNTNRSYTNCRSDPTSYPSPQSSSSLIKNRSWLIHLS